MTWPAELFWRTTKERGFRWTARVPNNNGVLTGADVRLHLELSDETGFPPATSSISPWRWITRAVKDRERESYREIEKDAGSINRETAWTELEKERLFSVNRDKICFYLLKLHASSCLQCSNIFYSIIFCQNPLKHNSLLCSCLNFTNSLIIFWPMQGFICRNIILFTSLGETSSYFMSFYLLFLLPSYSGCILDFMNFMDHR